MVECLLSVHKAMGSIPGTAKVIMSLTHALMEEWGHTFRLQQQPSLLGPLLNSEMVLEKARMGILEDHGQGNLEGIILWG